MNSASTSAASANRLGTGLPSTPRGANEKLVEKPAAPAAIPSRTAPALGASCAAGAAPPPRPAGHHRALRLGRGPLVRRVAHHEEPQRRVADIRGEVEVGP